MSDLRQTGVDPDLLAILVCPVGLAQLELQGDHLVCTRCGTRYRIEAGGIPNLLVEEAELPPGVASYQDLTCWQERERQLPKP